MRLSNRPINRFSSSFTGIIVAVVVVEQAVGSIAVAAAVDSRRGSWAVLE